MRRVEEMMDIFMFQIVVDKFNRLISQIVISNYKLNLKSQFVTSCWGERRTKSYVFIEQGVAMRCFIVTNAHIFKILTTLSTKFSYHHFVEFIRLGDNFKTDFHISMCYYEKWSVRALRGRINKMLYEIIAISKNPEETISIQQEIEKSQQAVAQLTQILWMYNIAIIPSCGNMKEVSMV